MKIGIPKEIKNHENRVAITPAGVEEFAKRGHQVYIQKGAGLDSGFADETFVAAGASILNTMEEIYAQAEMVMKVKEPIEPEYKLIRKDQLVFAYFHFASCQELTEAMINSGATCLAYETVELPNKYLPLLVPMSEIAGRMAVQAGAKYLEKPMKGKGILLGGVPGVAPAKVLIIGGGMVGIQAAKMAAGLGAQVTITDISLPRLRYLSDVMPGNVTTLFSHQYTIQELLPTQDLVVGAVLQPGAKAPYLIKRDMIKSMQPGSVIVDVAIDQGGCVETSKPTTHESPIYLVDDVVHYCVANIPGAVPYTSTTALVNATLPYALQLAEKGWKKACNENNALKLGLNVIDGKIVYKGVAEAFNMEYTPLEEYLS